MVSTQRCCDIELQSIKWIGRCLDEMTSVRIVSSELLRMWMNGKNSNKSREFSNSMIYMQRS